MILELNQGATNIVLTPKNGRSIITYDTPKRKMCVYDKMGEYDIVKIEGNKVELKEHNEKEVE